MPKIRLDQFLLENGYFESRSRAQAAIMAGVILVNEQKIDKPGTQIKTDSVIRILGENLPFVSRGGLKLEKALAEFDVDPAGKICLDIGASTGGFTDCLLQKGAAKVFAVDVGYGQMHLKVRNDNRVIVIEKTNARYLTPELLYGKEYPKENFATLAVMDVSFISILKVLPALKELLAENGQIVSLVKPQFEAGRDDVGKGGIIKDPEIHKKVVASVISGAKDLGFDVLASTDSPIQGAAGNREFFVNLALRP